VPTPEVTEVGDMPLDVELFFHSFSTSCIDPFYSKIKAKGLQIDIEGSSKTPILDNNIIETSDLTY
jgi:hypothetical protein